MSWCFQEPKWISSTFELSKIIWTQKVKYCMFLLTSRLKIYVYIWHVHSVGQEGRKRTMEGGHGSPGVGKKKVKPCAVALELNDVDMKRGKVTVAGDHSGSEKRANERSEQGQKPRTYMLTNAIMKPITL